LSVTDSNNVTFKYYEIETITAEKSKLLRKNEVTVNLKRKMMNGKSYPLISVPAKLQF